MRNDRSNLKIASLMAIWFVRLCLIAFALFVGRFWWKTDNVVMTGKIVFSGCIGLGGIAVIASFIRAKYALILLIVAILSISVFICCAIDIMCTGPWWELLIVFAAQMAIPSIVACGLWQNQNIRDHYFKR